MPKVKDAKTGKFYTSHWQTNPRNYLKETCLQLPQRSGTRSRRAT